MLDSASLEVAWWQNYMKNGLWKKWMRIPYLTKSWFASLSSLLSIKLSKEFSAFVCKLLKLLAISQASAIEVVSSSLSVNLWYDDIFTASLRSFF